jgi:hypothetical protein
MVKNVLKMYGIGENTYSLRPKVSVVCASQEITLTKYIVKNINIYST